MHRRAGLGHRVPAVTDVDGKIRENRLRRMAKRQGLHLHRSRRRDPRAVDYGLYFLVRSADIDREVPTAGLTLDQVEQYLTD